MPRYRIIYQNSNIDAPEGTFDIGRSLDCNLVLDDPSVSRVHATIVRNGDDLALEDRGSRNGCSVNGQRVSGRIKLGDGDVIKIGHQIIKIAVKEAQRRRSGSAKNTMGLAACSTCGHWMSMEDHFCPGCGTPKDGTAGIVHDTQSVDIAPTDKGDNTSLPTLHSGQMIAGLARKALGKHQYDEALKLGGTLMETTVKMVQSGEVADEDLETIVELFLDLGLETKSPERISDIFLFFSTIQRLLPRKSVELLYKSIRKTGYRSCPEMHRYLGVLGEMAQKFSPGEKFIYRRIEGLVGLCS